MALAERAMFLSTTRNFQTYKTRGGVAYMPGGQEVETLPEMIVFKDSTYVTSDPEEIALLRARAEANPQMLQEIPVPTSDPSGVLSEITRLAIQRDAAAIAAVLRVEEEGEQRPVVLESARESLDALKASGEMATRPPGRPRKPEPVE